jgi:integrase
VGSGWSLLAQFKNDPCFRTMLLLAVSFGLRISELLGLKWSEVDWVNKTIRIERGVVKQIVGDVKTSCSPRTMVCADDLLEVLKQWRQTTQFPPPDDWMFASPAKLGRQPISYTHVWYALRDAATDAGIGHVSSHVFRHTPPHMAGFSRYAGRRATAADAPRGHPHHDEPVRLCGNRRHASGARESCGLSSKRSASRAQTQLSALELGWEMGIENTPKPQTKTLQAHRQQP